MLFKQRGCGIHVVSTAWLGHPRLMNGAGQGGGRESPVTAVHRERSDTKGQTMVCSSAPRNGDRTRPHTGARTLGRA